MDPRIENKEEAGKAPAKFTVGSKEFENMAEADSYIRNLEQDKIRAESYAEGMKAGSVTPQQKADSGQSTDPLDALENEFFTDPAKTLAGVEERATRRAVDSALGRIEETRKWETSLGRMYEQNPELKGREELVDAMIAKYSNMNEYAKLSYDEGLKHVAGVVKKLVGAGEKVMERSSTELAGSTSVPAENYASSSGDGNPALEYSMAKQVSMLQSKRRKAVFGH